MSVPDYRHVVEGVAAARPYNFRSKADCGRFTEDCVLALRAVDPDVGHLRKPEHRNHVVDAQGNRHAVDSVLFKSLGWAVDIILASASDDPNEHPGPSWHPDEQPFYSAADWYAPPAGEPQPVPVPPTPQPQPPSPSPYPPVSEGLLVQILEELEDVRRELATRDETIILALQRVEAGSHSARAIELRVPAFGGTARGTLKPPA